VWCDLTQLLGGERFWSDIETAVRERSAKFLFVLSRSSNQKAGPLDELQLAFNAAKISSLNDFVIPLWIDDLPASEFNVRLGAINAVKFQQGWAAGLAQLVKKLEDSDVQVDERFGPKAVGTWWLENVGVELLEIFTSCERRSCASIVLGSASYCRRSTLPCQPQCLRGCWPHSARPRFS
jgi:hypothetical protein